jgi:hypothetical protein
VTERRGLYIGKRLLTVLAKKPPLRVSESKSAEGAQAQPCEKDGCGPTLEGVCRLCKFY